jgi:hypothetical protein
MKLDVGKRHRHSQPWEPRQQPTERLLQFHPRQLRPEAVVSALAEGHVCRGRAQQVEMVRLGEGPGVPVPTWR